MTLDIVQDPIDFEAFESCVHEWFSSCTDLHTVWRVGSVPQPEYPFGSLLTISGPIASSPDWELRTDFDQYRPSGQEFRVTACVPCSIVVSCQAYVGDSDARNPAYNAGVYIRKAQSSLSLPSVTSFLSSYNVSVYRHSGIAYPNKLVGGMWESRAGFDVTFGTTLNIEEYNTYIEQFQLKSTSLGVDEWITLP